MKNINMFFCVENTTTKVARVSDAQIKATARPPHTKTRERRCVDGHHVKYVRC